MGRVREDMRVPRRARAIWCRSRAWGSAKILLLLEINGGLKGKQSFWDHVQMGGNVGISASPGNSPTNAPAGTAILLHIKGGGDKSGFLRRT